VARIEGGKESNSDRMGRPDADTVGRACTPGTALHPSTEYRYTAGALVRERFTRWGHCGREGGGE
jgi:hypothetical protein